MNGITNPTIRALIQRRIYRGSAINDVLRARLFGSTIERRRWLNTRSKLSQVKAASEFIEEAEVYREASMNSTIEADEDVEERRRTIKFEVYLSACRQRLNRTERRCRLCGYRYASEGQPLTEANCSLDIRLMHVSEEHVRRREITRTRFAN